MKINGVFIRAVFCQECWVCGFLKCFLLKCSFLFSALTIWLWCLSINLFKSLFFCLFDYISFYTVSFCRIYPFRVCLFIVNSSSCVCWGRASIFRWGSGPLGTEITILVKACILKQPLECSQTYIPGNWVCLTSQMQKWSKAVTLVFPL